MSILIKGMDMPKENVEYIEIHADGLVCTHKGYKVGRAVSVPTPHGRLIDADAHLSDMGHGLWDWETVNGIQTDEALKQSMTDIRNAPTIIEAEE